jgi:hypothetical protein
MTKGDREVIDKAAALEIQQTINQAIADGACTITITGIPGGGGGGSGDPSSNHDREGHIVPPAKLEEPWVVTINVCPKETKK